MADIEKYLNLIPSANRQKPKFVDTVAATVQPFADCADELASFPAKLDIDAAEGDQLDILGEWIGQPRTINVPLAVYLTLDTNGLGLDQGVLKGPYSPDDGVTDLPDSTYRTLLKAKIARNHWDGTIERAYALLEPVFPNNLVLIQDHGDMSMTVLLIGPRPDAPTLALFEGGYLSVKPGGVRLNLSYIPGPAFGLDVDNARIGGPDHGYLI